VHVKNWTTIAQKLCSYRWISKTRIREWLYTGSC